MSDINLNGRRRVVITGVGMVTPLGNDPTSTWESLLAGTSGAGPITHFDTSEYDVHFACELKGFEPTDWMDRKKARRMDRFSQLALSAARMAEADSGLDIAAEPERVGAAVATGIGGLYAFEDCFQNLLERGPDRTSPFAIVQIIPNMAAAWVSMELGAQGPLAAECTACAASNMAIGDGLDAIRLGRADASHVSDPDPTGANPARAMRMAFADAGIDPDVIGYVNAHGTSTPSGDAAETRVLKLALGEEKALRTPVSSTKGATGHCLGAAGAVEAIFCTFALQHGVLPPTINYEDPDPTCDLDYIPNEARRQDIEVAVNNSFGFGGHNACVVFRRWDEAA